MHVFANSVTYIHTNSPVVRVLHDYLPHANPLGLVSPITFHGKVFLQNLWRYDSYELKWDESLSEPLCHEWNKIVEILRQLVAIKFHILLELHIYKIQHIDNICHIIYYLCFNEIICCCSVFTCHWS